MDIQKDTYLTIATPSQGLFKDRGSRFIGFAYPVDTEEEIKEFLKLLKKKYYDATHHCYAYAIGIERELFRQNDDGEPSGTAGKPIYGQILSQQLTHIFIVVVRYYGGTKLGVPGLINAYREAASDAIANAQIITKILQEKISLEFDYPDSEKVMKVLKKEGAKILEQKYEEKCYIQFEIRLRDAARLRKALKDFIK